MFYPCVNVYLGTLYIYTKFRPDRISNMAVGPGGHQNQLSPITLELVSGVDHLQVFIIGTSNKDA
jgi:hypothetical protein